MNAKTRPLFLFIFAWFCLALVVGVSHIFENVSAPVVAATVWGLTIAALILCWIVPSLRSAAIAIDLSWLLSIHIARFVGIYFLILASRGELPMGWAKPAGIGDIITACGAFILLVTPSLLSRGLLLAWNVFGLLDILFVVFSALRFGLADWNSMAALRTLPLGLLPTFAVPLIIATHVLIFLRLKRPHTAVTKVHNGHNEVG